MIFEMFLSKVMGFGWEEVHEVAEQMEHLDSQQLFERMDEMLDCNGWTHCCWDDHGIEKTIEIASGTTRVCLGRDSLVWWGRRRRWVVLFVVGRKWNSFFAEGRWGIFVGIEPLDARRLRRLAWRRIQQQNSSLRIPQQKFWKGEFLERRMWWGG